MAQQQQQHEKNSSNKNLMITTAAILAVVALAAAPFVVSSSNLVQTADAKEKVKEPNKNYNGYRFYYDCTSEDPDCVGTVEVDNGDPKADKATCDAVRDEAISEGGVNGEYPVISDCKRI